MSLLSKDHRQSLNPAGVQSNVRLNNVARAPARLSHGPLNRWIDEASERGHHCLRGPSTHASDALPLRSAAADSTSFASCARPQLASVPSGKQQRISAPLSLRVLSATHSASLLSSPCTPDVVGGSFTPGGVFDDVDDEWDALPITPADQHNEALATPDSDSWRSATGICSDKSVTSTRTALTGMVSPNAQATLPSASEDNILWPLHSRTGSQAKDAKASVGLGSDGCSVTAETILRNVGSHMQVEADEKLHAARVVPGVFRESASEVNVDQVFAASEAGDEFIVLSTPASDTDVDAAEIAKAKRVVISKAHASAHDTFQCDDGGNSPSPTETFAGESCCYDVKPRHSFHSDQQPSFEVCDAASRTVTRTISTPASDEFPAPSSFLPANFFDDDLDIVDSRSPGSTSSLVNAREPARHTLGPADGTVGPMPMASKNMHDSSYGGAAPSSAWQLDFTHGSVDPVPELVNLSPEAAALFTVLGIATEPSEQQPKLGSDQDRPVPIGRVMDVNVASSPISSIRSSEEEDCLPALSSGPSSRASPRSFGQRADAPFTQPVSPSSAVNFVNESLLPTGTSSTTGCSEPAVSDITPTPNHLRVASADSDFRHLLGHWLAAYVVGRLAHCEAVGAGNIAADWSSRAVQAREIVRTTKAINSQAEYSFYTPRPTPRAIDRTSGRFAEDPYGVLKRHGIVSAAPNMAFVQIVTEFLVRRRIPAETIVAAAWFVDNLPVHDVDGELGFNLRGSLSTSNGEPFAIERRLAMIALYLADMSISDFNYNLASWSNAFGVPKDNAVRIEREALASLGYSVSIPIQSWRDHCKNVYALFTRATYLPGVSTLSLCTMHSMVVTARGAAEDAAGDVNHFCQRQKEDLDCEAISVLRRIQLTIDTSCMPAPVTRPVSHSVYHTPASNQENVAPQFSAEDDDGDDDEFTPYDGAAPFPAPAFAEKPTPAASMLPTPPYDGADSFPEPAFSDEDELDVIKRAAQSTTPSVDVKVADWLHSDPNEDDEDSYEEYDGAAPFPDPVPLEPKAPKYSMSIQVEASSLARSPLTTQAHAHAPKRARYAVSPKQHLAPLWRLEGNHLRSPAQQSQARSVLQPRLSYAALSRGYSTYYPQDQLQLPKSLSAQPKFLSSEAPHFLTREQLRSLAVEHHPRPVRAPYINGVAINHGRVDALEAAAELGTSEIRYAARYPTEGLKYGLASKALLPTLITALINAAAELEPLKKAPEPVASATAHRSTMATVA